MTYDELNDYYGNPGNKELDHKWFDEQLVQVEMPFYTKASWEPFLQIHRLWVHRHMATTFKDALRAILLHRGEGYLINRGYNYCGGAFNHRKTRGGKYLSTHAWGIAIDLNPHLAPYRRKKHLRTAEGWQEVWRNDQPEFIIEIMLEHGFWSFEFDGMHFQGCTGLSNMALGRV